MLERLVRDFHGHYSPQTVFKVSTAYDLPGELWTIGGQLRYSPRSMTGLFDGTPYRVEQPDYTLVDLMAAYRVTDWVALRLDVENLFDKTYFRHQLARARPGVRRPRTATA